MRYADATVSVSVGADEFMTGSPSVTSPGAPSQQGLPSPGELPFTGTAAAMLAVVAFVLIVAGLALIVFSQRRSPTHA